MDDVTRDPKKAQEDSYDLIIVGAGIYGICLNLEAARRGLKSLLLEKSDFGGEASLNSLRILHGGLRYLQTLDLPRFFESVQQRGWFMEKFPALCRPLECIMPLYGKGLKRKSVFNLALPLNNFLSFKSSLPPSRIASRDEVLEKIRHVRENGLEGGAAWYDGQILSPQRLHLELIRWAASLGAKALNYVEAKELLTENDHVIGIRTNVGEFRSKIVINAAGGWADELSRELSGNNDRFIKKSLAFNVLLKRPALSEAAVAMQGERVYFITPHQSNHAFVGTIHQRWNGKSTPDEATINAFLTDLNKVVPGWELQHSDILRTTSGIVPSKNDDGTEMAHRSIFKRHSTRGFFSISGNKYTTAQSFAIKTLTQVFGKTASVETVPKLAGRERYVDPRNLLTLTDHELEQLMLEEAVTTPEDLIERRMDWIFDGEQERLLINRVKTILEKTKT